MTEPEEEGVILHWGYVTLVAIFLVTAGIAVTALGWKWLWIAPAVVAGLLLLNFIAVLFEDRWRMVTDADAARGAPATCRDCGHGLDIIRKKERFKVRCPICGHRQRGAVRL